MSTQFSETLRAEVRVHVGRFAGANDRRAVWEIGSTVVLYVAGLAAFPWVVAAAKSGPLPERVAAAVLAVLIATVQVALYIRTFLLNHDLLHGALFSSRRTRRAAALLTGTLACTTPSVWKREHDRHHRDSNNLDLEQDGQTASWTSERFLGAPVWHRRAYHVLNLPWVTYTVLPLVYFFGFMRVKARWYENIASALFFAALWATGRLGYFFATFSVAAIIGFYLFHLQHTFPGVYKRRTADWDFFDNAMLGSSFLDLPRGPVLGRALRWFSYGVECHHVHHLNPRIPGYRLARCHEAGGALFAACPRVTLRGGLRTIGASLYDERAGTLASVRDYPLV